MKKRRTGRRRAALSSSEAKNAWHEVLERVSVGNEEILITRYGKPIARLTPVKGAEERSGIIGFLAGTVRIEEDLIAPTGAVWDADA